MSESPQLEEVIKRLAGRLEKLKGEQTVDPSKFLHHVSDQAENISRRHKEELHRQNVLDRVSDRKMRESYANKVFWFMVAYATAMFYLLICAGTKCIWFFGSIDFSLPDIVLTTISGTTAVAVVGLVGFVVKGLFIRPSNGTN